MTEHKQIYSQVVHCLKCDDLYGEINYKFIKTCPHCNNNDTKKTVYLEIESDMYQEFIGASK